MRFREGEGMKRMEMRETEEEEEKKTRSTKKHNTCSLNISVSLLRGLRPRSLPCRLCVSFPRRALAVFLCCVRPRLSLEMPQKPHTQSSTTPKKVFTHPPQKKARAPSLLSLQRLSSTPYEWPNNKPNASTHSPLPLLLLLLPHLLPRPSGRRRRTPSSRAAW